MDRPRFVFVALGTHGDMLPPLAIAAELVARGHECRLLANACFAEHAAARGVGFTAISATDLSTPPGAEFGEAATGAAHAATIEFFRTKYELESLALLDAETV